MAINQREVIEGTQQQGEDEVITYDLTVDPAPSVTPTVAVYEEDVYRTYPDVTATAIPSGSVSFAGSVITLPPIRNLTRGKLYRVEVKYSAGSQVLEPFFKIQCER